MNVVAIPWLIVRLNGWIVPPLLTFGVIVYIWMFAEQFAVAPPLTPKQLQVQGPLPLTAEDVPMPQRSAAGAAVNVCPLLLPQVPLPMKVIVSVQLEVIAPVV